MLIEPCTPDGLEEWVKLRLDLWPEYAPEELQSGAVAMIDNPDALVLIARAESGEATGFAEASVRRDYVNGCETSPVTFLEGIYVAPAHRRKGIARAFAERIADWGRARGHAEFASDALLENGESHAFHAAIGFAETERVVYFRKAL